MTFQASASFAVVKKNRVPLAQIDVRGTDAARPPRAPDVALPCLLRRR
jgi:hypothetical protein